MTTHMCVDREALTTESMPAGANHSTFLWLCLPLHLAICCPCYLRPGFGTSWPS
uniref:Uncharacterized protein n=1 Tax=Arundo donax TaxID=35708 RepID=A0A0A9B637_ARUDO